MKRTSLALCLCLAACSNKDADNAAPAAKQVEALPAARATSTPPFAFDAAAIQAKLQGAWVMRDRGIVGSVEAWEVHGDQVKIWDAAKKTETTGTLTIDAPCQLTVKSQGLTSSHFVFDGDTLHMGLGDTGVKLGDKVVACMSFGFLVLDATKCEFFTNDFDKWASKPATCGLTGDKFTASSPKAHFDGEMDVHGSVFATDQLWKNTPTKVASYDEAKAKAKP